MPTRLYMVRTAVTSCGGLIRTAAQALVGETPGPYGPVPGLPFDDRGVNEP